METQKVRIWHEGIELTSEVNQSEVLNPHLTQPKLSRTQQKKKNRFEKQKGNLANKFGGSVQINKWLMASPLLKGMLLSTNDNHTNLAETMFKVNYSRTLEKKLIKEFKLQELAKQAK